MLTESPISRCQYGAATNLIELHPGLMYMDMLRCKNIFPWYRRARHGHKKKIIEMPTRPHRGVHVLSEREALHVSIIFYDAIARHGRIFGARCPSWV